METSSLIFMILVEGAVTVMAVYFFLKMLRGRE